MTDRTPKPLEQYRHFKGGRYQVLCLAEKEDTGETLVIYQALYEEAKIYARTLSDFTSPVDRVKYPSSAQYWRFERILPPEEGAQPMTAEPAEEARGESERFSAAGDAAKTAEDAEGSGDGREPAPAAEKPRERAGAPDPSDGEEETITLDPAVEEFLDAERAEEKLSALTMARDRVTDDMIDIMAASMGIEIEPGPIQERYEDLKGCLLTISRYELDRTRFRH